MQKAPSIRHIRNDQKAMAWIGLASAVALHAAAADSPPPSDSNSNWQFVPQVSFLATYDDNFFIRPTNPVGDTYFQLVPGFAYGLGDFRSQIAPFAPIPHFLARTGEEELPRKNFIYVNYLPDIEVFTRYQGNDTINQNVQLAGQEEGELWNLQGNFQFQSETDADIDVGHRIRQSYSTADGSAAYALTGKLTAGVRLQGEISDFSGGLSSTEGRATVFIDDQIAPKTTLGLGFAGGDLDVQRAPNQIYGRPLLRWKYDPTAKLSFSANGGQDFRQFGSNTATRSQFVFDGTASYVATASTQLTMTASRDVVASAEYADADYRESLYQAKVRQRVFGEMYGGLAGGYVQDDYENDGSGPFVSRQDDYYFYKASAAHDLTKHGTIELSYEHRENDSSIANFGFTENLVSVDASFLF